MTDLHALAVLIAIGAMAAFGFWVLGNRHR